MLPADWHIPNPECATDGTAAAAGLTVPAGSEGGSGQGPSLGQFREDLAHGRMDELVVLDVEAVSQRRVAIERLQALLG